MPKTKIYKLEADLNIDFGDTTFLYFRNSPPGYELIADLNTLFHLQLHRIADMALDEALWPFYTYADPRLRLGYHMIEAPVDKQWTTLNNGDKILIINGRDSDTIASQIESEFKSLQPMANKANSDERFAIVSYYQKAFMAVDIVEFNDEATSTAQRANTSQRFRGLRGSAALAALLARITDYIEYNKLDYFNE